MVLLLCWLSEEGCFFALLQASPLDCSNLQDGESHLKKELQEKFVVHKVSFLFKKIVEAFVSTLLCKCCPSPGMLSSLDSELNMGQFASHTQSTTLVAKFQAP